jgi:hypothetical protein
VQSQLQVALNAESKLAWVGLEQAINDAGLMVGTDGTPCVASIGTEGAGLPHPDVDVSTDGSRVTVILASEPSPQLWTALGRLVHSLLPQVQPGTSRLQSACEE